MVGLLIFLATVLASAITGFVTLKVAKRTSSGSIAPTEAQTLWLEADKMRIEYRAETVALRTEVVTLREENVTMRHEQMKLREESGLARLKQSEMELEMGALRRGQEECVKREVLLLERLQKAGIQ